MQVRDLSGSKVQWHYPHHHLPVEQFKHTVFIELLSLFALVQSYWSYLYLPYFLIYKFKEQNEDFEVHCSLPVNSVVLKKENWRLVSHP